MGPRIIKLEAPSATQNAIDNLNEDIFMPFSGKDLITKIFGTKEDRQKRRAERKAKRLARKSNRQKAQEEKVKQKALSEGKSPEEASKIADAAGNAIKQEEEIQIQTAGKAAVAKAQKAAAATNKKITEQEIESARDKGEQEKEAEIFSGYGQGEDKGKVNFWNSMTTTGKIALVGGTALVIGVIVWGIKSSSKK